MTTESKVKGKYGPTKSHISRSPETPIPVLLLRNVQQSKYKPLSDGVNLVEVNAPFAYVKFNDG